MPEKGSWFKTISFLQDGTVRDDEGNVLAGYNKNQWLKVEVSFYPATFDCIVKLNGKKINESKYFEDATGNMRVHRFRIDQAFSPEEGVVKSGAFYIDDFKAYQGSYQAKSTIDDMVLTSRDNDVYNGGGAIIIDDDSNDSFTFDISAESGQTYSIYTDSTCSEKLGEFDLIGGGNVLVLTDGNLYKYYMILWDEAKQPPIFVLQGAEDGSGNDVLSGGISPGTVTIVPDITVYQANIPLYVVAAQYSADGKLISIKAASGVYHLMDSDDAYAFGKNMKPALELEVENIADSFVKLMVWNGTQTMVPYMNAQSIAVNAAAE